MSMTPWASSLKALSAKHLAATALIWPWTRGPNWKSNSAFTILASSRRRSRQLNDGGSAVWCRGPGRRDCSALRLWYWQRAHAVAGLERGDQRSRGRRLDPASGRDGDSFLEPAPQDRSAPAQEFWYCQRCWRSIGRMAGLALQQPNSGLHSWRPSCFCRIHGAHWTLKEDAFRQKNSLAWRRALRFAWRTRGQPGRHPLRGHARLQPGS